MSVIFLFSTDWFSASQTESLFALILRSLFPSLSEAWIQTLHIGIRKFAHMFTYGLLSFLYGVGLTQSYALNDKGKGRIVGLVLFLTIVYASLDEWHQSFSPSRTGTILDVGWDAAGAILVQALLWSKSRLFKGGQSSNL